MEKRKSKNWLQNEKIESILEWWWISSWENVEPVEEDNRERVEQTDSTHQGRVCHRNSKFIGLIQKISKFSSPRSNQRPKKYKSEETNEQNNPQIREQTLDQHLEDLQKNLTPKKRKRNREPERENEEEDEIESKEEEGEENT